MVRIGTRGLGLGIFALFVLVAFIALMFIATLTHMRLGVAIYLLGMVSLALGFVVKEDTISMGAIMGLSMLVILDLTANIGVLTHW